MPAVYVPLAIVPRPPALDAVVHDFGGDAMGTTWRVRLAAPRTLAREPVGAGIRARLAEVVAQMSTWEPASDLCRFNAAPAGAWRALPPAFMDVLACGLEIAARSGGAFDPAAGALVDAWGFGPAPARGVPDDATIAAALARGGWRRLRIDRVGVHARQPGGLALDLSAIAKGYAVDRIADWLATRGVPDHLVEVGGELRGAGVRPDGQPWWVALESPGIAGDEALVALHGLAVATSGDYHRWFEQDGERYAHTLDPRDGRPVRHGLASVSVLHARCMAADALSTALTVLGPDEGLRFATRERVAARFVVRTGDGFEARVSPALAEMQQ